MASLLVSINFSTPSLRPLNSHPGNYNRENQLLLDYQAKQQPGQKPTAWSFATQLEIYFL
uniref:Uncharacterized protein n=1 Tax=Salix viminalis TaxID=40686 RepID=A0A6N2LPM1_SALVM